VITRIIMALAVVVITLPSASAQLPVIPGASGFGIDTGAGRGGRIIRVTNLNEYGAGSLRAALEASGPRVVIFDVSGTVFLTDHIRITHPWITVAGQTAPSPGITVAGAGLQVITHDVLIQHLRVRPGDLANGPTPHDRDALAILSDPQTGAPTYNVVIDHCSFSWALDETVSTWYGNVRDVTLRYSIVSEGLANATHPYGSHSMGLLIGDNTKTIAVIGNLFAHNDNRNPVQSGGVTSYIANNIVYNFSRTGITYANWSGAGPNITTVVGNDIIPGPATIRDHGMWVEGNNAVGTQIYLSDNRFPGATDWDMTVVSASFDVKADAPPISLPTAMNVLPAGRLVAEVLPRIGARPADRDAVDARIVGDVTAGTGRLIDSQRDVGGWPQLPNNRRVLQPPANPNGDDNFDGYTNLENWLHAYAAEVEGRQTPAVSQIRIGDATVFEDAGVATVELTLDQPLNRDQSVLVYTQPKTAINGQDFYGLAQRVEFPAGTVSQKVQVQIIDDDVPERYEYFSIHLQIPPLDDLKIRRKNGQINMALNLRCERFGRRCIFSRLMKKNSIYFAHSVR